MTNPPSALTNLDTDVRSLIYTAFIEEGLSASLEDVAGKLNQPLSVIRASYRRLAQAHALVLQPDSGEVLMANPFSAVPTAFRVEAAHQAWWGNCVWDALGVCAMTGVDAAIRTSCPDCGEAVTLAVKDSRLEPADGIVHFAVPAARWWEDVVFT